MQTTSCHPRPAILVVDQEPAILRLLYMVLTDRGLIVYPAATAAQALELCQQHWPAIALVDLECASSEGRSLLADLRRIHPGIRFCVMGAGWDTLAPEEGRRLGVGHYFAKPLTLQQLVETLERVGDTPDMGSAAGNG